MSEKKVEKPCKGCRCELEEPYIACSECTLVPCLLCLSCFARGFEDETHENCHDYEVLRNDFCLLDNKWTALEERKLVDAVLDSGLGNWGKIALQVATRTSEECEFHYNQFYIENPKSPLPYLPEQTFYKQSKSQPVPCKVHDDPPRPALSSQLYKEMAGYMAARSDFLVESDNYAENDICTMAFEDSCLRSESDTSKSECDGSTDPDTSFEESDDHQKELKLTVLEIYNRRLKERARKKKILSLYGLIHVRKAALSMRRYVNTIGRRTTESLLPFMHLVKPVDFDLVMESFHYEQELKHRIRALQEFRQAGITHFKNANFYVQMKQSRDETKHKRHYLDSIIDQIKNKLAYQQWLHKQAVDSAQTNFTAPTQSHRRPAPPLDISGLPGQEKLHANEKQLCSTVRLVPEAYLEFKALLISEYQKQGSLRLAQARSLIKIDVNKTRKLFDFLVAENYINKESPSKP